MSELRLPSDYEGMRPFKRLVSHLHQRRFQRLVSEPGDIAPADEVMCAMAASYLWMRLWCELSLLARSTNRPGWLPSEDRHSYEKTVAAIFGDDCRPVDLLVQCGLLVALADGWMCELFALLNPHTAGNFQPKELRGAHHSALVRNKQRIAHESHAQAMLLAPEVFQTQAGERMNEREVLMAMNCIKTLDNQLKYTRPGGEFTQALVAQALQVVSTYPEEDLTEVYLYVRAKRDHPGGPKTAETILNDFPHYLALAKS